MQISVTSPDFGKLLQDYADLLEMFGLDGRRAPQQRHLLEAVGSDGRTTARVDERSEARRRRVDAHLQHDVDRGVSQRLFVNTNRTIDIYWTLASSFTSKMAELHALASIIDCYLLAVK